MLLCKPCGVFGADPFLLRRSVSRTLSHLHVFEYIDTSLKEAFVYFGRPLVQSGPRDVRLLDGHYKLFFILDDLVFYIIYELIIFGVLFIVAKA